MTTDPRLTIGPLSKRICVNTDNIRYYERIGLSSKPPRSSGGHRLYADDHKQRLVFIRRARDLGFSLNEVRAILGLTGSRRVRCAKVNGITEQHIAGIRKRIRDLKRLERALGEMVELCPGNDNPDCAWPRAFRSRVETREGIRGHTAFSRSADEYRLTRVLRPAPVS
jgi:MerR family transcriptional regulator, mercuric resistance operon regulatory protein